MDTLPMNMYEFLSYTGFTRRNTVFIILVAASQEYVNTYSTRRVWVVVDGTPYVEEARVKGALQLLMNHHG